MSDFRCRSSCPETLIPKFGINDDNEDNADDSNDDADVNNDATLMTTPTSLLAAGKKMLIRFRSE